MLMNFTTGLFIDGIYEAFDIDNGCESYFLAISGESISSYSKN
jgi:hypothetical protein